MRYQIDKCGCIIKEKISRRKFLKIAVSTGLTATGVLTGPFIVHAQKEPIRLGELEPLTGAFPYMGYNQVRGCRMAVEEINAKGGVLGRKIELIVEDTATHPGIGLQKAIKLVRKDKVHFLCGCISSAVAQAVSDFSEKEKIIFMGFLQYADELTTSRCHRHYFRTVPNNTMYARAAGSWMAENVGKTWHFITADYVWGHDGFKAMKKIIEEKGGKILGNELVPLPVTDFSSYLLKIKATKPDVLGIIEVGIPATNVFRQLLEFGLHKEMQVGGPAVMHEDPLAVVPNMMGYWGIEWDPKIDTPASKDFVRRYEKRFNRGPSTHSWASYTGTTQLMEAVARAGTTDHVAVIKALEGHRFDDMKSSRPAYWREWDHQCIQDVFLVKAMDSKKQPTQKEIEKPGDTARIFEIMGRIEGEKVALTREESPCKLEPL